MTITANHREAGWRPDWAVAPGAIVAETLRDRGMTQVELARRTGRPLKAINEVVKGKAAITADAAVQLEAALGVPARFWMNLQRDYDEARARAKRRAQLAGHVEWAGRFPVTAMTKRKLLRRTRDAVERVEAILEFFGVASPEAWRSQWQQPAAAFRRSTAHPLDVEAISAWLRWGQRVAIQRPAAEFDAQRLLAALPTLRSLSLLNSIAFRRRLLEVMSACGVHVLYLPELPGTRVIGATHWSTGHPIIQLSLRHKTDDQFWFAVFHELAHVLSGDRGTHVDHVDDIESGNQEISANDFARNTLLPLSKYEAFVNAGDFSASAVRAFADQVEVSTGVVVGRLEHDRHVRPGMLRRLKTAIDWAAS